MAVAPLFFSCGATLPPVPTDNCRVWRRNNIVWVIQIKFEKDIFDLILAFFAPLLLP